MRVTGLPGDGAVEAALAPFGALVDDDELADDPPDRPRPRARRRRRGRRPRRPGPRRRSRPAHARGPVPGHGPRGAADPSRDGGPRHDPAARPRRSPASPSARSSGGGSLWVLLVLVVVERRPRRLGDRAAGHARRARTASASWRSGSACRQVLILIAFMFSFVLAMSAAFLAAPAIASDVETGTVLAMLARPLRRSELLVGRWLGLSIVVGGYAAMSGLLAIAVVDLVSGHVPPLAAGRGRLPRVRGDHRADARALARHAAAGHRRRARSPWSCSASAGSSACWAASRSCSRRRRSPRRRSVMRVIIPTDGLWRGVIYGLEPPLVLLIAAGRARRPMAANPFFASARRRRRSSPGASCGCVLVLARGDRRCSGGASCEPRLGRRLADRLRVEQRAPRAATCRPGARRCRRTRTRRPRRSSCPRCRTASPGTAGPRRRGS